MPEITAFYCDIRRTGQNAVDRPEGDREAPSVSISANAPKLFNFLETLDKKNGRSPYACAEAQALAKLLAALKPVPNKLSKIMFTQPTSHSGYLLWELCGNCKEWLEKSWVSEWVPVKEKKKKKKKKKTLKFSILSYEVFKIKDTWDT